MRAALPYRLPVARRGAGIVALVLALAAALLTSPAAAADAAVGYRDFSYAASGVNAPTGEKPQSKLWFADATWWGALFNRATGAHHIYRLDTLTQTWMDTGVELDPRNSARLDVLWDGTKLYVVSAGRKVLITEDRITLRRYSYVPGEKAYRLDPGFPVTIAEGGTEAAVVDKDTTGAVWITYTRANSAYIAHSTTDDLTWTAPYVLPFEGARTLRADDISAVVAYDNKVGVMWSNQRHGAMYFATHDDGAPDDQWTLNPAIQGPGYADDHISLRSLTADDSGRVYAVTKTELTGPSSPLILVLRLSPQGSWSRATFGRVADDHTRPILLVNREARKLYVFAPAPCCDGGTIYYKESSIDHLSFEPGIGTPFIQGIEDRNLNNPTSTKQEVSATSGMVVLASDDTTRFYLHNHVDLGSTGTPPDTTPPDTIIDAAPPDTVTDTTASFTFSASENGAAFECSLDSAAYQPCTSPQAYTDLTTGTHTFTVRATDPAGNTDPTPATHTWTIQAPTDVTVTFPAVADARVQESTPKRNFATAYLFTDAGTGVNIQSHLRFEVTGLIGPIERAVLRVRSTTDTIDGPSIYTTAGGWTETGLTWLTRPSLTSSALAKVDVVPAGAWAEFDLTATITGDGIYDLAMVIDSEDGIKFSSREEPNAPQLVITTRGAP